MTNCPVYCILALINHGDVVELVDTHALGACAARREGSSPFIPTNKRTDYSSVFLLVVVLSEVFLMTP